MNQAAPPTSDARLRHELRTPLNHIIGYSEMLTEEANAAGQTAFLADLENIRRAAHSLLNLLDDLFAPTTPVAAVAPKSAAAAEPLATAMPNSAASSSILLVDDNADNRDLLARRLECQGHSASTAENGVEALQKLRQAPYDLVLLDIAMPHMDGFAVLAQMQADPALRRIPVIMISAFTELDSVVKCIEMGAEDYLPKPCNPTLLRARIDATLEKKRLREQEQAYREQVLRSEAALERHHSLAHMVAGVAHEINTPLGIASTAASIIANRLTALAARGLFGEDPEIFQDLLESTSLLKNNVVRAHKLVETFKKISVGQATDKPETVDLRDLLQDCVDLFKIDARQAKLAITVDDTRLQGSREWFGYPGYMTQVVMNLLQNVVRYAYPNGQGGTVDIAVFDADGQFGITVRDYGQGIPREYLDKIFEPFFSTGRDKGGTGLGLAIVGNIVDTLFNGRITAASEPGGGACFTLYLPKSALTEVENKPDRQEFCPIAH